jgi:hypothetical protein
VLGRAVLEKAPLFVLAAAGSAIVYRAQSQLGATEMLRLSLPVRAANAVVSAARYLGKLAWPTDLSVFYPHPESLWPAAATGAAAALLVAATAAALALRRQRPWWLTGWLWFLGTLVPMLGFVQVGWQAMADRYTYVPLTGLLLAISWEAGRAARLPRRAAAVAAVSLAVLAALVARSRDQARIWRDTRTLFTHALAVDPGNWLAHENLGAILVREGQPQAALGHLERALVTRPEHANVWYNLGCAQLALRQFPPATASFERAIRIDPTHPDYHMNLGIALFSTGRLEEAVAAFRAALRLKPDLETARQNLAWAERMMRSLRSP